MSNTCLINMHKPSKTEARLVKSEVMSVPATTDALQTSKEIVVAANLDTKNPYLVFNRPRYDLFGGRRISTLKEKETKELLDKFDVVLKTIKDNAKVLLSVSEVAAKIPSLFERIQSSCTFDKLFFTVSVYLKWYDTEDLANICADLKISEILKNYEVDARQYLKHRILSSLDPELVLPGQNVARQCVTKQTRNERLGVPYETLELIIDGAWDDKPLKKNCDEVCRKIVSIYGRPSISNETISGTFNNSTLYINIYR